MTELQGADLDQAEVEHMGSVRAVHQTLDLERVVVHEPSEFSKGTVIVPVRREVPFGGSTGETGTVDLPGEDESVGDGIR